MPVTFQVVGNLADFGNDVRAGVKVRATATPGVKVGDVAVHSNQPETVVTDETGAFTLELVSLPGVWYRIQTPYANAINTVNLAGYVPDSEDPTTGTEFPALTVIDLKDVMDEDPTPGHEGIAYAGGGGGGVTDHGALTGLGDDDHGIYALADGTRGTFAAPLGADDNYVTDAEKTKLANLSGTNTGDQTLPTWSTIAGKPAVVAAGATQADARTAIGAGTSSIVVGTGAGDAKAGNYQPTAANISDSTTTGRALLTAVDAAAARTSLALGTAATTASTAYATAAQGTLADSALQPATAQAINAQTGTTYTLVAGDVGKVVTLDNAAAITLNAPGSVFTAGQRIDCVVIGAGMATVVGTSGATANGTPSLVSRARWSAFTILWTSATACVVIGDMA